MRVFLKASNCHNKQFHLRWRQLPEEQVKGWWCGYQGRQQTTSPSLRPAYTATSPANLVAHGALVRGCPPTTTGPAATSNLIFGYLCCLLEENDDGSIIRIFTPFVTIMFFFHFFKYVLILNSLFFLRLDIVLGAECNMWKLGILLLRTIWVAIYTYSFTLMRAHSNWRKTAGKMEDPLSFEFNH